MASARSVMRGYLQTAAESGQAPLQMVLHRGDLGPGELGHFTQRPAEAVDEDDGQALTIRELGQEGPESGLAPGIGLLGPGEDRSDPAGSGTTLSDPQEIADRVGELLHMCPV